MTPAHGHVWLDGEHIQHYASKEVARRIGLLAQNATTPGDITVQELVARGRYPHQPLFTRWRKEDEDAVTKAMQATGITHLADQSVDTLSGGQRQRAWIAMVLAQETAIMLLDEPTTWLDISHQIDLLELLSELNREKGYTLAAVLHDLNQACRYASHLIALREGKIVAQGAPKEIVTAERHLQPQRFKLSGLPSWHPVFWMPSHDATTHHHKPPSRRPTQKGSR